jgi:hypothetical protein
MIAAIGSGRGVRDDRNRLGEPAEATGQGPCGLCLGHLGLSPARSWSCCVQGAVASSTNTDDSIRHPLASQVASAASRSQMLKTSSRQPPVLDLYAFPEMTPWA